MHFSLPHRILSAVGQNTVPIRVAELCAYRYCSPKFPSLEKGEEHHTGSAGHQKPTLTFFLA